MYSNKTVKKAIVLKNPYRPKVLKSQRKTGSFPILFDGGGHGTFQASPAARLLVTHAWVLVPNYYHANKKQAPYGTCFLFGGAGVSRNEPKALLMSS